MEMEINRDNYEAYLLDMMEGRLTAGDAQRVRDFLSMNPDCAFGFEDGPEWSLEPEKVSFPDKENLVKEFPGKDSRLTTFNFDLFFHTDNLSAKAENIIIIVTFCDL